MQVSIFGFLNLCQVKKGGKHTQTCTTIALWLSGKIKYLLRAERIFEDHENLVENLLNWTRDSQNRLMFTERIEKYAVFKNPQVGCLFSERQHV